MAVVSDLTNELKNQPNSVPIINQIHKEIREFERNEKTISRGETRHIQDKLEQVKNYPSLKGPQKQNIDYLINKIHSEDQISLKQFNLDKVREVENTVPELSTEHGDNVVFLLGAGASAASDIPLVRELLEKLVEQARRTQDEGLNELMEYCSNEDSINIEDLLTAVYLSEFAVSEPSTLDLLQRFLFNDGGSPFASSGIPSDQVETDVTSVNFIQDTLQTLFGSIASEMIPKDPNETHTEIREFVKSHENVSIITTNYDYCMDEKLLGDVNVNTGLDLIDSDDEAEESVDLYKLHGSINWTYCDTCQSIDGVKPEAVKEKFDSDSGTLDYPVIGICPVCKGQRRPLLVPPTSFKFVQFPPLIDIRKGAMDKLNDADYIIPVGYSFSDADAYVYKLVWGAMRRSDDTNMIVVDPSAEDVDGVATELRDRFEAQVEGFDGEERIKSVVGRSEKVMEDLVKELLDYEDTGEGADEGEDDATTESDSGGETPAE